MNKLLKDGAVVIALATGLFYTIGSQWETTYLESLSLPVPLFLSSPSGLISNGFNCLYNTWEHRKITVTCLLFAPFVFGLLWKSKKIQPFRKRVAEAYTSSPGAFEFLVLAASVTVLLAGTYRVKNGAARLARNELQNGLGGCLEVEIPDLAITGRLVRYADGYYAIAQTNPFRITLVGTERAGKINIKPVPKGGTP